MLDRFRKLWPYLKLVLAAVIVVAVGRRFYLDLRDHPEVWEAPLRPGWLILSAVLYQVGIGFSGLFWYRLLRSLGQRPSLLAALRAYYISQLGKYVPGKAYAVVFDRPGVVSVGCNIHDWMLAYIVVLDTPWFAKTADDGAALIAGAPPGRYRAEVWHPRLAKPETREITLNDGAAPAAQAFSLTLKPDRRIRRAPDAGPGGYR